MVKVLGVFIFVGIMLAFMIFSTPVTRLGSGFLIGDGQHVFTYHDLVKEAELLNVKFPNEDDIEANIIPGDPEIERSAESRCPAAGSKRKRIESA